MKNNRIFVGIVVGVIILAVVGSTYVMSQKKTKQSAINSSAPEEERVEKLKPEDVGLDFIFRKDKKAVKFSLAKINDIQAAEYEITYKYDQDGEEREEALIGEVKVDEGADIVEIEYRDLGTCSSGVCRYQKVTSDIKLVLKITKKNGKHYVVEDVLAY